MKEATKGEDGRFSIVFSAAERQCVIDFIVVCVWSDQVEFERMGKKSVKFFTLALFVSEALMLASQSRSQNLSHVNSAPKVPTRNSTYY
jgi:hypothetical protein